MYRRTFIKGLLCLPFIGFIKEKVLSEFPKLFVSGPPTSFTAKGVAESMTVIQNAWTQPSQQDILKDIDDMMALAVRGNGALKQYMGSE